MTDTVPATDKPAPSFALGIGLTNECNLACAFCYRDPPRTDRLAPEQVKAVIKRLPKPVKPALARRRTLTLFIILPHDRDTPRPRLHRHLESSALPSVSSFGCKESR